MFWLFGPKSIEKFQQLVVPEKLATREAKFKLGSNLLKR